MIRWRLVVKKLAITVAVCLAVSCTFQVNVPPISVVNTTASPEKYDATEAYKSVGMVALRPTGSVSTLGIGTAFAVNETTLLTAGHVCTAIKGLQADNTVVNDIWITHLGRADKLATRRGAVIKAVDSVNDLCELELKQHGLLPLKLADYKTVKFDDDVYIVGAPSGVMISVSEGKVMNPLTGGIPGANNRLAVTSAATGGHSGSPTLNSSGEVVGMLVSGHTTYDHLSFCVPSNIILRFMKYSGIGD